MTIVVVGGGKMGMSHLAIATQYAGKQNVALCETSLLTRFLFARFGYRTFGDLDSALRKLGRISGLIVATPTRSHGTLARWALDRGIPCFVEKPLTLDVAESEKLVLRASETGVFAQTGFVLRFVPAFLRVRALVEGGELGSVTDYTARMSGSVITEPDSRSWRTVFAKGGGCLNEYGPHLFDLCRYFFGDIETIGRVERQHVHSTEADDRIAVDWVHRGGAKGELSIDWCDTTKRKSVIELDVRFEHARLLVDNSSVKLVFSEGAPQSEVERIRLAAMPPPPNVGFYLRGEEFSLQLETFLGQCIGQLLCPSDPPPGVAATLSDGLEADRLIDSIARKSGLK